MAVVLRCQSNRRREEAAQKVTLVWSSLNVGDLTLGQCELSPSRDKIKEGGDCQLWI